ncbi:hypothetical protein BTO11_03205 [Psychrosphaera saromensis]|uniref:Cysteine-rich CWC family protein n=2 Tax=Psychrosphaera saromensis TaxID=716813 RepID=A0A2S7UYR2_9GAMM|nr:hypothetical protein BTO11_03205 [Psychrosphaera saromensis]
MTTNSVQKVNPQLCPLCTKDNACGNLLSNHLTDSKLKSNYLENSRPACDAEKKLTCWCQDPNIQFPPELLQQVPDELKNKTCICQSCAMAFKA